MENILTIKERILSFLDAQGIRKVDFFEATGIQSSNFKGRNMQSQPGGDMLLKVLTLYPTLSAEWLLRGNGNMLLSHNIDISKTPPPAQKQKNDEIPQQMMDKFLTTIQDQAEEIGCLKEQIRQMTIEKEKHVSDADTSNIASAG